MSVQIIKKDGVYHITAKVTHYIVKTIYDPIFKKEYVLIRVIMRDQQGKLDIKETKIAIGQAFNYTLHTTIRPQDIDKE